MLVQVRFGNKAFSKTYFPLTPKSENRLSFFTKLPYRCAPQNIWSLGVILVNLTCARNPWAEATFDDPTYYAFTKNPNVLTTILEISDELSSILCQIFDPDQSTRITIEELKHAIMACPRFTR